MTTKKLYMGTTTIEVQRTAGEIISELVKAGASSINTEYKNGEICGIRWIMKVNGQDALFEMPARVEPIHRYIRDLAQARRVAWRQLLRWVQAQNAMIETGMVQPMEVFAAYWIPPGQDRTLFANIMEQQLKALPPAS